MDLEDSQGLHELICECVCHDNHDDLIIHTGGRFGDVI